MNCRHLSQQVKAYTNLFIKRFSFYTFLSMLLFTVVLNEAHGQQPPPDSLKVDSLRIAPIGANALIP